MLLDPDLADLTEDEILEGVQEENVTAVRRVAIRRNDIRHPYQPPSPDFDLY